MSDVIITTEIQAFMDRATSFPRFTGMTVTNVTDEISLPVTVTNPLLFSISMLSADLAQTGTAHVILPDTVYNSSGLTADDYPYMADQLWALTFYNDASTPGLDLQYITAYWDQDNHCIRELLGFDGHTPVVLSTVHPQLQSLVTMISTVTNTVNIYEYTDKRVLTALDTGYAYLCYCMFGSTSTVDYLGGAEAISFIITENDYLTTSTHQLLVNHAVTRITEYKAIQ